MGVLIRSQRFRWKARHHETSRGANQTARSLHHNSPFVLCMSCSEVEHRQQQASLAGVERNERNIFSSPLSSAPERWSCCSASSPRLLPLTMNRWGRCCLGWARCWLEFPGPSCPPACLSAHSLLVCIEAGIHQWCTIPHWPQITRDDEGEEEQEEEEEFVYFHNQLLMLSGFFKRDQQWLNGWQHRSYGALIYS